MHLISHNTNKSFYSHTAAFYESKPGRVLLKESAPGATQVPVPQYLEVVAATMQNIPSLLQEVRSDEANDMELWGR